MNQGSNPPYPARLEIDAPGPLNRVSTLLRLVYVIPIMIILVLLTGSGGATSDSTNSGGEIGLSIGGSLFLATVLMLLFRCRYPRWWFDFARELTRFSMRVGAYLFLLTDRYPSTEDEQTVHLELDYPAAQQLNRWLPLVKWLLAIPHYIVLAILVIGAILATMAAWFAILVTGRYPRGLFDYVVGVFRWGLRVQAYAFLLLTDRYPPFSMASDGPVSAGSGDRAL